MSTSKRGRPKTTYDPNIAKQVQAFSQYAMPQEEIANHIGIDAKTLRKLYRKELDEGQFTAHLAASKTALERAMSGDTAMLIFYLKTQLKWREAGKENDKASSADNIKQMADAFREAFRSVGKCRS